MKSRFIASLAVGSLVLLGASGCAMMATQATTIEYSAADGVNVPDSGPIDVRNALLVAGDDGEEANFVAALVNNTNESHTLSIEFGEEGDTVTETIRVPANTVLSLGTEETEPLTISGLDFVPGSDVPGYFTSGDAEGAVVSLPVLDGSLEYLADLVP